MVARDSAPGSKGQRAFEQKLGHINVGVHDIHSSEDGQVMSWQLLLHPANEFGT